GDVDQAGHATIGSRRGDDSAAVRMTDENGRAADPPERPGYVSNVACNGIEAVLGGYHLVPVGLELRDYLAVARAVSPQSVGENDAWLGLLGHGALLDVGVWGVFSSIRPIIGQMPNTA